MNRQNLLQFITHTRWCTRRRDTSSSHSRIVHYWHRDPTFTWFHCGIGLLATTVYGSAACALVLYIDRGRTYTGRNEW